ncbi:MAG: T9SS type A sorting domain-containing protein [Schleiferiaceae bacterium]|nr:T9SS type A sorting domain-containing protein [Schleiferiaceae bacterium]
MRKHYFLFLFALVTSFGYAQLRSVTFQVDMLTAAIDPAGIHMAGDFQDTAGYGGNWIPDTTKLTQVGTSNIYQVTVMIPDGKWRFKFINGNSWNGVEGVPADNQVGGGDDNRFAHIVKDTTLAAVHFAGWSPTGLKLMRLQVDLAQQTGFSKVTAAGDWQAAAGYPGDWDANTSELFVTNPNTPTVYENIYYVPADTFAYKFITDGSNWENVPGACAVNNNREIIVGNNPNVPGTVCYAMCTGCPTAPIPQYNLTLMVDMQNHLACNMMDSLDVAGTLNGWAGGDQLSDMGNNIWSVTMPVDSGEVKFKFRSFLGGNVGWEGVSDRVHMLTKDDTVKACYNVDGLTGYCTPIPAKADVTFRVDMATWGGAIDTAGVFLIGDFTSWQTNAIKMTPQPGGIYETTVSDFCPGAMFFKFVNGTPDASNSSNEENAGLDTTCAVPNGVGGWNRFHERQNANPIVFNLIFDSCDGMNISVEEEDEMANINVFPNPVKDFVWVDLTGQKDADISIIDLSGRTVKTLTHVNGMVKIERGDMTSGVYIMQIMSGGSKQTVKLILE